MIPLGVLASARVGGWTPASLSLVAWFDASDPSTITESGGAVSQWADKSGNGYHATQSNKTLRPYTGTRTLNGLNAVESKSLTSSMFLTTGTFTQAQPFTVAIAGKYDGDSSTDYSSIVSLGTSSTGRFAVMAAGTERFYVNMGASLLPGKGTYTTNPTCFTTIANVRSSSLRLNAAAIASGNIGELPIERVNLGAGSSTGHFPFYGVIGEVVIASGALSGADLANLESYLMTKWGIA